MFHLLNQFVLQIHLMLIDVSIKGLPVLNVFLEIFEFSVQLLVLCFVNGRFRQVLSVLFEVGEGLEFLEIACREDLGVVVGLLVLKVVLVVVVNVK